MSTDHTDHPTEDDARALLAKAAATIDVDQTAPMTLTGLPEPRHRRWPVLAAAAAVVLAIGGGALVPQQLGDDPAPSPAADPSEPIEQEHVYADDELPSLIGYTREEAESVLAERGLEPEVRKEYSCNLPKGYVIGADPGPGTPVKVGDRVSVRVVVGILPNARCFPQQQAVWDLVRFARGLGPAPNFTDEVSIVVGARPGVTLSAEEAADPENWILCDDGCHSALAAIAEAVSRPVAISGHFAATSLVATDRLFDNTAVMDTFASCFTPDPFGSGLPYHRPTYVYVDHPVDGPWLCPPAPVVQIGWTEDWQIGSVVVRLASSEGESIDEESLEGDLDRLSAAQQFAAWARGEGPAPAFADRVRLLQGGGPPFGAPTWLRDPTDRSQYSMCSGLPPGTCAIDPIFQLDQYVGAVVPARGRALCVEGVDDLPPYLAARAAEDLIRLTKPEPPTCQQDLPVELWIDEDGVIYGVNQAGSG